MEQLPPKTYDESLEMVMNQEADLLNMGITASEIARGKSDPYGFIKRIGDRNYFLSQKKREVRLPDRFGDHH